MEAEKEMYNRIEKFNEANPWLDKADSITMASNKYSMSTWKATAIQTIKLPLTLKA